MRSTRTGARSFSYPALTSQRGRKSRAHVGSTYWTTLNTVQLRPCGTSLVNGETQGPSDQPALARVLTLGMTSDFS
jgi:hypothetical protein